MTEVIGPGLGHLAGEGKDLGDYKLEVTSGWIIRCTGLEVRNPYYIMKYVSISGERGFSIDKEIRWKLHIITYISKHK